MWWYFSQSQAWMYLCAENMRPNLGNFRTKQVLLVSLCEKNKMFWTALYVSLILFIEALTVLAYIREHLLAGSLWKKPFIKPNPGQFKLKPFHFEIQFCGLKPPIYLLNLQPYYFLVAASLNHFEIRLLLNLSQTEIVASHCGQSSVCFAEMSFISTDMTLKPANFF